MIWRSNSLKGLNRFPSLCNNIFFFSDDGQTVKLCAFSVFPLLVNFTGVPFLPLLLYSSFFILMKTEQYLLSYPGLDYITMKLPVSPSGSVHKQLCFFM